jgi:putative ABC transport system permease protein
MKILYRYTLRSLRMNRVRTLVTVIGIILSVALFTAVTEGAYSGQQYMIRVVKEQTGSFDAFYRDIPEKDLQTLRRDERISMLASEEEIGYAEIESEHEDMPYLYLVQADPDLNKLLPIKLTQGRMPQSENELVIPDYLYMQSGLSLKIGQTITLTTGQRTLQGKALGQNTAFTQGETFTGTATRTYTVVGIYEKLSYLVEGYNSPGFLCFSQGGGNGIYTSFFSFKDHSQTTSYMENSGIQGDYSVNRDLLYAYGTVADNNDVYIMLYGFMAILLGLITFGAVALIYNSFAISVSERTKQFGLLKSIGATNRQVLHSVLFEALILCAIGIPIGLLVGCGGLGLTFYFLRDSFSSFLRGTVTIKLALGVLPILLAAGIGLITALLSAWIPAIRVKKLSAIDAIRQSRDIKIRGRQLRTAKLTQKLFGFPGMLGAKNYKRNRKRYRATVISLFLSVVLFISASAFSMYLTDAVNGSISVTQYDISYLSFAENKITPDTLCAKLGAAEGVTQAVYLASTNASFYANADLASKEYRDTTFYTEDTDGRMTFADPVVFVEDSEFRKLLAENGLPETKYFDFTKPYALLYDNTKTRVYESNGSYALEYSIFNDAAAPFSVELCNFGSATGSLTVTIGGVLKEQPYYLENCACLIFPYSAKDSDWAGDIQGTSYLLKAENHKSAYKRIVEILQEEGLSTATLFDPASSQESSRALVTVVRVFAYGFIVLISLIAAANVFNTISTNILLRRREFAMLKSVGMTQRGFRRMMNYECILYGFKSLIYGLPVSILLTWLIYKSANSGFSTGFYLPWKSIVIAVISVFAVVFATMLYSMHKIRRDNPIDALKDENL